MKVINLKIIYLINYLSNKVKTLLKLGNCAPCTKVRQYLSKCTNLFTSLLTVVDSKHFWHYSSWGKGLNVK